VKRPAEDKIKEACLVAGFFMLGAGLWLLHPSAALIICGCLLLYIGLPRGRTR
jgi:hypothetical protein